MRILLLSNLYPPDVQGGAEILAADIAGGLTALGHEVLVLTSGQERPAEPQKGPVWRTLRIAPPAHFDGQRPPWQQLPLLLNYYRRYHRPANAAELQRIVALTRPDVVYIWEITGIGVNSLLRALPRLDVPIVFHLGSYWLLYARSPDTEQSRLRMRRLKQWLIGAVDQPVYTSLIAVSETVRQEYVRAGYPAERIEVIYNGIDARFLSLPRAERRAEDAERPFQLLFVGRLRVEKGLLVLLRALDLLVNGQQQLRTTLHLNIFGTGDQVYANELRTFLHEKQMEQIVTLHGRVSQDELIRQYDLSDIMLVPSLWQEPFGLVIAEAMARGLPVIASAVGGPAEILTDGVDGLLVEPGNEQELASAIEQLLADQERRSRLARAAQETVRERFTIQENARRVEQHLLRAIERKKSAQVLPDGVGVL